MVGQPKYDWDEIPLGEKADREIADEYGIPVGTVCSARLRYGIPPATTPTDWSKIPLGTKPDRVIAKKYGISVKRVGNARREQGIEPYQFDWDTIPLGELPDSVIAKQYKVSPGAVRYARKQRSIPGVSARSMRYDWASLPLGQMYDADIARKHGLKPCSVSRARQRLGIAPYTPEGQTAPNRSAKKIDWDNEPLLGKVPDSALAKILGLSSSSSVTGARRRRGIKPYKPPTYHALQKIYIDLFLKWRDPEAVAARLQELSEQASTQGETS